MVVSKNRPGKASNDVAKEVEAVFEEFAQARDSVEILVGFQKLKAAVGADNIENGKELYAILKSRLQSWKCKSLWEVLDARAKHKEYGNGSICEELQVLVIGAGPIGLRTAIEVALLGAKVVIVEKRTTFGRNNVLHLWPFLIQDFRSLGAKRFYGKFCAGSLDHISIRILQCMLMKTALILGVQIYTGVTFEKMLEPTGDVGWRFSGNPPFHPASQLDFDMVIGADGKKNVLPDFPQIEMRGSLAIGITLNLVYHCTKEEAAIPEVSGLAYHFKPQFFDELYQKSGVRLENFVYYKNETHYFVMTAVKSSLLARGALLMDYPKPADLLHPRNINVEKLKEYALDAVRFGTGEQLRNIEFVINDRGKPDIAVFDFTSLKKAEHAARIIERKGHRLLMALVGDSLIEPFWPTGSGCARGVLSALDTAWMLRSFAMDKPPLQVLGERESVYKLLSATTVNNLRKKYDLYTINPFSRYVNVSLKSVREVYHLYDSDDPVNADFRVTSPSSVGALLENTKRRLSVNHRPKAARLHRKSSSDDLDEKKDFRSGSKKVKNALRRSRSRDLDEDLGEKSGTKTKASKSRKSLKKLRSRQSSESADEKDVRGRRQRKLGRTKSRDTDGSNNSLDTITESPKTKAKAKNKDENKDNSLIMKRRSTKRWRLFGGTKPKEESDEKHENPGKDKKIKSPTSKEHDKKHGHKHETEKKNDVGQKGVGKSRSEDKKGLKKVEPSDTFKVNNNSEIKRGSIKETVGKTTLRQLNSQDNSSPKPPRNSCIKPSELRASKAESHVSDFARSASYGSATMPRRNFDTKSNSDMRRTNSEIRRREGLFGSLRRTKQEKTVEDKKDVIPTESPVARKTKPTEEKTRKDSKGVGTETKTKESVSVFDDIKSLSPAAQRTAPLLVKLTPEKKDRKYSDAGAVSAVAGIAAMVALTTPLAMEEKEPLKEFQMKRQKILSGQANVKEKVPAYNTAQNSRRFRRDLSAALDNADGSPKPVKRFFSFSTAQKNVKEKLEDDSRKAMTLPRRIFGRHSLKNDMWPSVTDIPSALDSAIDILIKQYDIKEIQNTLKLMLNIFRRISKDPEDETPRRVCAQGYIFRSLIWNIKEAKLFMIVSGWMEIGSFIVLPKSKTAHEPIRVLMQNYRALSEQQALDTSCPQLSPIDFGTEHRPVSDDIVRPQEVRRTSSGVQYPYIDTGDLAKDDGRDTGSHSSDSGMGFSETASDKNVPAAMSVKTSPKRHVDADVTENVFSADVVPGAGSQTKIGVFAVKLNKTEDEKTTFPAQRTSVAMDPRKYLEDSYNSNNQKTVFDPAQYLSDSGEPLPAVVEQDSEDKRGGKEHEWEILEQCPPSPRSPEETSYAPLTFPLTQNEQKDDDENLPKLGRNDTTRDGIKNSSLREAGGLSNTLDALIGELEEPMDDMDDMDEYPVFSTDAPNPVVPAEDLTEHKPRGTGTSTKERNKNNSRNELDDLFDTLDFVTEVLEPPRVVCTEKPTNEPKKGRKYPKSTETSRRREKFTQSKLQGSSVEGRSPPKPKRKARNQAGVRTRQGVTMETGEQEKKQTTRKEIPRTAGRSAVRNQETFDDGTGESKFPKPRANDVSAVQSEPSGSATETTSLQLRRSRRIAESSERARKAILTLQTSGDVEESSTDLNQAFMSSRLEESHEEGVENGSVVREKPKANPQKRKVRRKSSIVKTNKSRARAKRTAFKSRKDRSIDE